MGMKKSITYGISLISILIFFYFGGCSLKYLKDSEIESDTEIFKKSSDLILQKKYKKALLYLEEIGENSPLHSVALMKKIKLYYNQKKYSEAYRNLVNFRKDLVYYPYFKDYYYYYFFKIKFKQKKFDDIIGNSFFIDNVYEMNIKKELKIVLARSLLKRKNYREAYEILAKIVYDKNNYRNDRNIKKFIWESLKKHSGFIDKNDIKLLKNYSEKYPQKVKKILLKNRYKDLSEWWEIYYSVSSYNDIIKYQNLNNGIYINSYSELIKDDNRKKNYLEKFINNKKMKFYREYLYNYLLNYQDEKTAEILLNNINTFKNEHKRKLFHKYFRYYLLNNNYQKLDKFLSIYINNDLNIFDEYNKAKIYYWKGYIASYKQKKNIEGNIYFNKAINAYPLSYYYFRSLEELGTNFISYTEEGAFLKDYKYDTNENFSKMIRILSNLNDYMTLRFIQKFISDKFLLDNCELFLSTYENNDKYRWSITTAYFLRKKYGNFKKLYKYNYPITYEETINKLLTRYVNFDVATFLALIHQESHFEKEAVSHAGAKGLIQIMPSTAKRIYKTMQIEGPIDLFNPNLNLNLGIFYLNSQLQRFDDKIYSLAAYNAGPTRVAGWRNSFGSREIQEFIELIPFNETRNYVKLIYTKEKIYKILLSN
ncbi:MAG: lytic transglycosylase domain-containing protein [Candidatus Mcinerneyibacterium aminivorans]|uniref:Lytic transglycosylase domain-containing protein n=1 Tax=Candidatus Mcinerneyibacterium aminivorans TaxID=2703815 RepID=A0A5D0MGF7_9BACT|nr:MAG: lytic transglycosylase domain-containing protein [Candidatus Mcinerneyibacterium aminivorans]